MRLTHSVPHLTVSPDCPTFQFRMIRRDRPRVVAHDWMEATSANIERNERTSGEIGTAEIFCTPKSSGSVRSPTAPIQRHPSAGQPGIPAPNNGSRARWPHAPLRSANRSAWSRNRPCTDIQPEPVKLGRSSGLTANSRESLMRCSVLAAIRRLETWSISSAASGMREVVATNSIANSTSYVRGRHSQ